MTIMHVRILRMMTIQRIILHAPNTNRRHFIFNHSEDINEHYAQSFDSRVWTYSPIKYNVPKLINRIYIGVCCD